MRIAFLGTPEFAVPSLTMLYENGHTLALFTQPDRPVGRHGVLTPPPAKVFARTHDIPVYQFEKIRSAEGIAALSGFAPDLMVTAAFGQLLSKANLDVPRLGCINVHGSLLPRYRGAAPIQWSIIDGCRKTGITTMFTDIGMDTGDILLSETVSIGENETSGELYERLADVGAHVLHETLSQLEVGTLLRIPQDTRLATKCPPLRKEDGRLDFSQNVQQIHNRVRGVNPWPGAYAQLGDAMLKIWETRKTDDLSVCFPVGTLSEDKRGQRLFVQCADGLLEITSLQLAGGKRMSADSLMRGKTLAGQKLL